MNCYRKICRHWNSVNNSQLSLMNKNLCKVDQADWNLFRLHTIWQFFSLLMLHRHKIEFCHFYTFSSLLYVTFTYLSEILSIVMTILKFFEVDTLFAESSQEIWILIYSYFTKLLNFLENEICDFFRYQFSSVVILPYMIILQANSSLKCSREKVLWDISMTWQFNFPLQENKLIYSIKDCKKKKLMKWIPPKKIIMK